MLALCPVQHGPHIVTADAAKSSSPINMSPVALVQTVEFLVNLKGKAPRASGHMEHKLLWDSLLATRCEAEDAELLLRAAAWQLCLYCLADAILACAVEASGIPH